MRVFTQRAQLELNPGWGKAIRGEHVWFDQLVAQFEMDHPNTFSWTDHPLDYCIVLSPVLYILGFYWGDESTLEAATQWVQGIGPHCVITCNDDQHPTELSLEALWANCSESLDAGHVITGYRLRSDPDNLVSVP